MPTETWGENSGDDYTGRSEDCTIYKGFPDTNYASLMVGNFAGAEARNRGLLRFTPNQDIPLATVASASLKLYCSSIGGGDPNHTVSLYRVLQDWVETEATWNIFKTGSNWNTAGAAAANDGGVDDDASYDRHSTAEANAVVSPGWNSWDVTSIVQSWVDGSVKEYGLLLQTNNETSGNYVLFKDSEDTDTERPYIEIEYTAFDPNVELSSAPFIGNFTLSGLPMPPDIFALPFVGNFSLSALPNIELTAAPFIGSFSISSSLVIPVFSSAFVGSFSLAALLHDQPIVRSSLTLKLGLEVGATLTLLNSLNVALASDLTLLNDILTSLAGSRTFKLTIEELAQIKNELTLINHILDEDSGKTYGDFYFSKPHGIT